MWRGWGICLLCSKHFLNRWREPALLLNARTEARPSRRKKGLKGRSAGIVVTMGMPALVYLWYFGAHSVKSLERNIPGLVASRGSMRR